MNSLIDKLIIFVISLIVYINKVDGMYIILPILIAVFISSILSYKENTKIRIICFSVFLLFCLLDPYFIFFIPLISYDLFLSKPKYLLALFIIPIFIHHKSISLFSNAIIISYIFMSCLLKHRTISFESVKRNYYNMSDDAKELALKFGSKNKELLDKQDYEIKLATLTERNRIARDIHDNVGHLLSRSILQIGALIVINKDKFIGENLTLIKDTLSEAMDSIRNSVHNLHDDSVDLQVEIQNLIDNFRFCPIKFEYDITSPPDKKLKYAFITITKESFSNIIKHSNADEVYILLREHPALYQLIIKDNGTNINYDVKNGIGIKSISSRVDSLGGSTNINTDNGFRIFISIPKNLDRMV